MSWQMTAPHTRLPPEKGSEKVESPSPGSAQSSVGTSCSFGWRVMITPPLSITIAAFRTPPLEYTGAPNTAEMPASGHAAEIAPSAVSHRSGVLGRRRRRKGSP
ncbi:unnamed protein product [Prorocentrum cordatum]|uniref:Uncharacterized protein n=1 Tax=Prorocentrum cordatum TaxID=2364126 RepID=A0ABN9WYM5_9DINO|nr:unnamed protein product [Polarella glacialis]